MNQVTCECGFEARAGAEGQVVDQVLTHVRTDHPDLVAQVTPDVVRGWIELVPDQPDALDEISVVSDSRRYRQTRGSGHACSSRSGP